MRTIRYRQIADELRQLIEAGEFGQGQVLPSESDLSTRYSASRVTIRKALEALRVEGLVDSRQGFGWFVPSDPLRQSLARLGTIEGQLDDSGRESSRSVLEFGFVRSPARLKRLLASDRLLRTRRLHLADGQPFACVTIWCPSTLAAEISLADAERMSFQHLLAVDLGGATQTIGAGIVDDNDAEPLGIPAGSAVLRCTRTTFSTAGDPVLYSEHVFPAHLTEFVVELPGTQESMAATGLRLVDEN